MVTSGTGHDRCPSLDPGPLRHPEATSAVATEKLEKPVLVSRGGPKIFGAYDISSFIRDRLFQLNLRLNRPDDPFEGSFGHLIVSTPLHCPIRPTLQFLERGDFVGAAGA